MIILKRRARERRVRNKLDARTVATARAGKYGDGGGLWLVVRSDGSRSWVYRFSLNGKNDLEMGLGSADKMSLAEARIARDKAEKFVTAGKDPRIARYQDRQQTADASITFREVALLFIEAHKPGWAPGTLEQVEFALGGHVYDVVLKNGMTMGSMPINRIDIDIVVEVLTPIWYTMNPTAIKVRALIERILSFAKVRKLRKGDNPATWRDNLVEVLPKSGSVHRVRHQPAIHYKEAPSFLVDLLDHHTGISMFALNYVMLCPVRINVAVSATWPMFHPRVTASGVEFLYRRWDVPEELMKGGGRAVEYPDGIYQVPLFDAIEKILYYLWQIRESEYVFPGDKPGTHLHPTTVLALAKKITNTPVTTHGFRSTFRSWVDDAVFCEEVVPKMCLGHAIGNQTDRAYRRADLLEKRRLLYEAYAEYVISGEEIVVDIKERFKERFQHQPIMMKLLAAE